MLWICRSCIWNANLDFHNSRDGRARYICLNCGTMGWMHDFDAPIFVSEEIADKYAIEFQTNNCFIPSESK